jgi:PAS domain S-box-containing protein
VGAYGALLERPDRAAEIEIRQSHLFESAVAGDAPAALEFINNILQSSTDYAIIGGDLGGVIVLWNDGARRLYGYEAAAVVGKAHVSILNTPQDVAEGTPARMLAVATRDGKWEGTFESVRQDQSRFVTRAIVTPLRDAVGAPIGFLLISNDISQEVRVAEELRASLHYTRALIESNFDALMTTDTLGIISDVNRRMESLTGRDRDELIGTAFQDYVTEPHLAARALREVLRETKVTDQALTTRSKTGEETLVSYSAATYNDPDGRVRGIIAAAREVTERKRFELTIQEKNLELERANRAKDRFLASMSHELRTPLNGILGFAGTLLMQLPGPLNDEQQRQLRTIQNGARHLLLLINDILDVAKIDSGRVELQLEPIECRSLVADVVESLRPLAEAKGLRLDVALPGREVVLSSDRRAFSQIAINLVNNAIKFTPAGAVVVSLEDTGGDVALLVADTGVGIRPEDQTRIFQAFERIGDAEHEEGTGLGLHLSQRLAELLGGAIELTSDHGRGSTFALRIKRR